MRIELGSDLSVENFVLRSLEHYVHIILAASHNLIAIKLTTEKMLITLRRDTAFIMTAHIDRMNVMKCTYLCHFLNDRVNELVMYALVTFTKFYWGLPIDGNFYENSMENHNLPDIRARPMYFL